MGEKSNSPTARIIYRGETKGFQKFLWSEAKAEEILEKTRRFDKDPFLHLWSRLQ